MSLVSMMKFAFTLLPVLSYAAPSFLENGASSGKLTHSEWLCSAYGSIAVSEGLLNQIKVIEQYAAAAYCTNNNQASRGNRIFCPTGNCPLAQNGQITRSFSE